MHARIESLDKFLREVGQLQATLLPTENYAISIETFKASGNFMETDQVIPFATDKGDLAGFKAAEPLEAFLMSNRYRLSLEIQNYGASIDALIRVLLRWLHNEDLPPELSGMAEQNNQSTYDLFIDFDIAEAGHKTDRGMVTC